jgi:hypothetical protein
MNNTPSNSGRIGQATELATQPVIKEIELEVRDASEEIGSTTD